VSAHDVLCEHGCAQTKLGVVCLRDGIFFRCKTLDDNKRSENFLFHYLHVVLNVRKHCGLDKVSFLGKTRLCTAMDELGAFCLSSLDVAENLIARVLRNLWAVVSRAVKLAADRRVLLGVLLESF
jgi:hypothetical protein